MIDQDGGDHGPEANDQQTTQPIALPCIQSQKNVGGKQTAEEHYFRREKQPDPNLGVPEACVATRAYGVGNFHLFMRAKLVRGRDAPSSARSPRSLRFAWCSLYHPVAGCIRKGRDKPLAL